jgi:hypothetical protein
MRRHRWVACAVMATLATVSGVAAGPAAAGSPRTGAELKAALPRPDARPLAGTTEFVGLDGPGRVALAVVVHRNGPAVAFLCDGTGTWQWFVGRVRDGRLSLRSANGARLTGRVRTRRIAVRVRGVATAAAVNGLFSLQRARRGAGLRRLVRELNGKDVELGWITANNGRIVGAGATDGTLVATTNTRAADTTENGEANPAGSTDAVPFAFLGGVRCGVIVIKIARTQGQLLATGQGAAEIKALKQRFGDLNCQDEGFAIPV